MDLIPERILWKETWLSFTLCHWSSCCLTWGTENTFSFLQPLFALVCLTGTGINTSTTFLAGILQILYMHIFLQIKNVRNPGFEFKLKLCMNLYGYSILRRYIHVFWKVVNTCSTEGFQTLGFSSHLFWDMWREPLHNFELSLYKHTHFHLQLCSWQCLNPILHCLLEIQLKLHTKHTPWHFVSKIPMSAGISSLSAYHDMAINKCKSKAVDFSRLTNIP